MTGERSLLGPEATLPAVVSKTVSSGVDVAMGTIGSAGDSAM